MLLRTLSAIVLAVFLGTLPVPTQALQATLEDGSPVNTKMRIETVAGTIYPEGVYYWDVEGVEHIHKQWFWYRIGGNPEASVGSVPHFTTPLMNDTTGEGYDDQLVAVYQDPAGLRIRIILTLRGNGAGSHEAWVVENIWLENQTASPMDVTFFQYSDFMLNANPADDRTELFGPNFSNARHEDPSTIMTQTISGLLPNEVEVDLIDGVGDILARMGDANPSSLNNLPGPILGNTSYAYRWDFTLGGSGSASDSVDFDIEKRIQARPPPAIPSGSPALYVVLALLLGSTALLARRLQHS